MQIRHATATAVGRTAGGCDACQGAPLRSRRVREDVLTQVQPEGTHAPTHGREAVHVRRLRQEVQVEELHGEPRARAQQATGPPALGCCRGRSGRCAPAKAAPGGGGPTGCHRRRYARQHLRAR